MPGATQESPGERDLSYPHGACPAPCFVNEAAAHVRFECCFTSPTCSALSSLAPVEVADLRGCGHRGIVIVLTCDTNCWFFPPMPRACPLSCGPPAPALCVVASVNFSSAFESFPRALRFGSLPWCVGHSASGSPSLPLLSLEAQAHFAISRVSCFWWAAAWLLLALSVPGELGLPLGEDLRASRCPPDHPFWALEFRDLLLCPRAYDLSTTQYCCFLC